MDSISKIFGCFYGPLSFTDKSDEIDNVNIPIETLTEYMKLQGTKKIDDLYLEKTNKYKLFIYPNNDLDYNFIIKALYSSIIQNKNISIKISLSISKLTQSSQEDIFTSTLISMICNYFIYINEKFNLEIVSIILQHIAKISKSNIISYNHKNFLLYANVKRSYFVNKDLYPSQNITSFIIFCITLDFIREYITKLRMLINKFLKKHKHYNSLEFDKKELDTLYNNMLNDIEEYTLSKHNKYIVKSIFSAIIGSAFGIRFINTVEQIPHNSDLLLSKLITISLNNK